MMISAPASRAATDFWATPPTSPTEPSRRIEPVTATRLPPVSSPGVSTSSTSNVKARPAEGPPTLPELMSISKGSGDLSTRWVTPLTPMYAPPPWGWVPSVSSTSRRSSVSESSTVIVAVVPGSRSARTARSDSTVVTGRPSTDRITSVPSSRPSAGPPGTASTNSTPVKSAT